MSTNAEWDEWAKEATVKQDRHNAAVAFTLASFKYAAAKAAVRTAGWCEIEELPEYDERTLWRISEGVDPCPTNGLLDPSEWCAPCCARSKAEVERDAVRKEYKRARARAKRVFA